MEYADGVKHNKFIIKNSSKNSKHNANALHNTHILGKFVKFQSANSSKIVVNIYCDGGCSRFSMSMSIRA